MAPLATATFSADLRDYIYVTRSKIDEWVEVEKAEIDAEFESYRQTVQLHQNKIDDSATQLLALQMENGLEVTEDSNNPVNKKIKELVEQKQGMKGEIKTLEERLQGREKESQDVAKSVDECKKTLKEVKSRKSEADLARQATIDDLTRGIVNNKYLGLDFEKTSDGGLRFVFTELDSNRPSKRFHFTIKANEEGDYIFTECSPSIDESITSDLLDRFNNDDDMASLVLEMRNAFLQTV